MKKICSLLLCLALLCTVLPLGAVSVSAATCSGTCGDNLTWSLDTATGTLTISGTGAMEDYEADIPGMIIGGDNYAPWGECEVAIKSVIIKAGVTSIGSGAFSEYGLTSVTIPDSVTTIGNYAFYYCTGLTSITIPDSVTTIGNYAFYNCTRLTGVYINDVAAWCNISFADHEANPLYYAHNLYLNGKLVTDLVIPQGVTEIKSYAFSKCTRLTSITIPDSVTTIGSSAFSSCTGLTSITIPDSVTTIGNGAFLRCIGLTSITIPGNVTTIGNSAFYGCTGLTSITIPDSVTDIGDYAFDNCTGLTSVTIGNSVTTIGDSAFYNCTGLTEINWNAKAVEDFSSSSNVFYNAGTAGDGITVTFGDSVEKIPAYLFYVSNSSYRLKVKSATFGNSVTTIGDYAFYYCTGLTSITIPNSVTTIGNGAFLRCIGLTSITIPDSVTDIGSSAFRECTKLASITVAPDNKVYHSAGNCLIKTASKTLVAGCKNSVIPTDGTVTTIGDEAFYCCAGLTSITIPNGVTTISYSAFYACMGLTSITIPDGVTTIGDSAFDGCIGLSNITIPDSVTTIGYEAFAWCEGLTSAVIPDSVIYAAEDVFNGCKKLNDVYYYGTEQQWKDKHFQQMFGFYLPGYSGFDGINPTVHFEAYCLVNGHDLGEITVLTDSTCTENGTGIATCTRCGETVTVEIPAAHTGVTLRTVAPTCTEAGYDICRCTLCNTIYNVPGQPAQGHLIIDGVCLACGKTERQCEDLKVGTQTHKNGNTRLILKLSASAEEIETYKDAGFVLTVDGEKEVITIDSVYDSFYNNGTLVSAEDLNCTYVSILKIGNIYNAKSVTVQGFYTDKNGKTVHGTVKTVR